MERLKYLLIGTLALLMAGCGQKVTETLNVTQAAGPNSPGYGRSIVILPFADYSEGNVAAAHRRNLKVTETLTDHLVQNGFGLPIQEDVFQYLMTKNIINVTAYEDNSSTSLQNEMNDVWSHSMKEEIEFYISQQQLEKDKKVTDSSGTHGLDQRTVAKMGRYFGADYIVRGRILEYKTREDITWEPWRKGILPFVVSSTSQILYGSAGSDEYDEMGDIISGMIWGAALGSSGNWPYRDGDHVSGFAASKNSVFWGATGGGLAKVSHNRGKIDQAVVQLRVWVQEAATGKVVWTNRVRVQVSPESVYADMQYDALFDSAIEKGVSTLVENFVTTAL